MSKISSSTSIRSKRMHSNFGEQNRIVLNRADVVTPVDPVKPVKNETSYSSGNYLYASDQFYEKLEKLRREYLNFYHSERYLKEAIDEISDTSVIDYSNIKNLIDRYNHTILALDIFDKHISSDNASAVKATLDAFSKDLNKIGIYIVREKELEINEIKFKDSLIASKDNLDPLLSPIRQFVLQVYRAFIEIRQKSPSHLDNIYDDEYVEKAGMILDNKA